MKRLLTPPGGCATAWSLGMLSIGILLSMIALVGSDLYLVGAGLSMLVAGGGVWFRKQWGVYVGAVQIFSWAVFAGAALVTREFSWMLLLIMAVAPYCSWRMWKLSFQDDPEPDIETDVEEESTEEMMVSLVALLPELPYFDAPILARLAGMAWSIEVGTEDDESEEAFVVGESPHFLAKYQDYFFAVHYVDAPYFDSPEEIAEYAPESRIRQAILEHAAWISIDLLQSGDEDGDLNLREAYRLIGKLIAELIDDDCLAIFCPEIGSIYAYHPSFQEKLTGADPFEQLQEMEFPPVIEIDADDPRMKAAVDKARDHWPEFVRGFENRSSEQSFSVKAPLADGSEREYIWINVTAIENNIIYGKLGNDPVNLPHFQLDDQVRVPVNDLNDWIYTAGDNFHGGFTLEILSQTVEEKAKRGHQEG